MHHQRLILPCDVWHEIVALGGVAWIQSLPVSQDFCIFAIVHNQIFKIPKAFFSMTFWGLYYVIRKLHHHLLIVCCDVCREIEAFN